MLPPSCPLWPDHHARDRTLDRIGRRERPERRVLGILAAAARHDDGPLLEWVVEQALAWPESGPEEQARKAALLFDMTALLVRAGHAHTALRVAPCIPFAPGMAQVLVFSAGQPQQRYCWRVTPAYALAGVRRPAALPVAELAQPYQRGEVDIDHTYLERALMPRRSRPRPILLLPHPLGQVRLNGDTYVILDGNHRVVCSWRQGRFWIPGIVLTPEEGAAVLISHSEWPPYAPVRHVSTSAEAAEPGAQDRPIG